MQTNSIDEDLSTALWNVVYRKAYNDYINNKGAKNRVIWTSFLKNKIDEFPGYEFLSFLKSWFFQSEWFEKYDLIEFICQQNSSPFLNEQFNVALKKEMSGYQIINFEVAPISNENEVKEIEEAINSPWESTNRHLESAITFLSNKENPDYRNSIKESISAVEAACGIITKNKKAPLT